MATRVIEEPASETVVHEHYGDNGNRGGAGLIIGLLLLLVVVFLVIFYGLPYLRSATSPQINVPGKIDVNVQTPNK